jgi:hypothetical protein
MDAFQVPPSPQHLLPVGDVSNRSPCRYVKRRHCLRGIDLRMVRADSARAEQLVACRQPLAVAPQRVQEQIELLRKGKGHARSSQGSSCL